MRLLLPLIAAVTLLTMTEDAAAQRPDDAGAVDEYVEDVPTSKGRSAVGSTKPRRTRLPNNVATRIGSHGKADAPVLADIASSSVYGAPQTKLRRDGEKTSARGDGASEARRLDPVAPGPDAAPEADLGAGDALSAAATTATGESSARLLALVLALVVISGGALAVAAVRHRRASP